MRAKRRAPSGHDGGAAAPRLLRHAVGVVDVEAAFQALHAEDADAVWLDSGATGTSWMASGVPLDVTGSPVEALRHALATAPRFETDVVPATIAHAAAEAPTTAAPSTPAAPEFRLGWVGWLGYELRAETTGAAVTRASGLPDAMLLRVDRALRIDAATGAGELVALGTEWSGELAAWRDDAAARLATHARHPLPDLPAPPERAARWHLDDRQYLDAIAACQQAIVEGEAYQLCLTNEARVDAGAARFDDLEVMRRLRRSSPTHHAALLRSRGVSLVSASPERFLAVTRDGLVETSPIKGTRPRGGDPREDAELAAELLASRKERAENLMIVDLMRNDLSRVSELGTVEVTRLLQVESYAQVHQLVSTVRGRLAPGVSAVDAVAACFPAGSMTGAPKRRATEVLDRLERRARGPYAGAFGYLGFDGALDLAMTIRSVVLDGGQAIVGAGGGITALSEPEAELAEVRIKAAPLLAALGVREREASARG